ncbi:MAG: cytochrome c [Myxococcales bacterium]|nr:cytochrome c [Myxococcales bacterium]
MMKYLCMIALLGSLSLIGCGGEETPATGAAGGGAAGAGDAEAGAAIYARTCLACHAADGKGNGGMTGANFVEDTSRLAKTDEQLLTSIRDGILTASPPMPPQGTILSEDDMKNVLAYIRREFGQH